MQAEEFDRLLKKTLEDKEFPYDPAAWEKAGQLFDQRRKRRGIWWWFVPAILFAGITASYWLGFFQQAENSLTAAPQNTQTDLTSRPVTSNKNAVESTAEAASESKFATPAYTPKRTSKTKTTPANPITASVDAILPVTDTTAYALYLSSIQKIGWKHLVRQIKALPFDSTRRIPPVLPAYRSAERPAPTHEISVGLLARAGRNNWNEEGKLSSRLSYAGGLSVVYLLNDRWLFELSPQLSYAPINKLNATQTTLQYGFGLSSQVQRLSVQSVWMFQLPVQFGMQLGDRHQFKAGPVLQSYVASAYQLETTTTAENGNTISTQSQGKGRVQDLQPGKIGWTLGYNYEFIRGWKLGVSYFGFPAGSGLYPLPAQQQFNLQLLYHPFSTKL